MTPTLRAAVIAACGLVIAVLPAIVDPRLWVLWAVCASLLLIAILADGLLLPSRAAVDVGCAAPGFLQIGETGAVEVTVATRGGAPPATWSALAELDDLFERQPESRPEHAAADASVSFPLVPRRRGVAKVRAVWVRMRGRLGLFEKRFRVDVGLTVTVLPDVRPVRAAALRSVIRATPSPGAKAMRLIGEGSDFAALRDFVPGHDHRAMSWRASARHRRLLVREFHAERDQPVVLAIDSGHLMSEPIAGMPRLDHSINAGLLLAWSCLKTGDRVGLFNFGARPLSFRAPEGGVRTFPRIREWAARLEYGADETNYTLALSQLSERLRRRSLVVLMTEFVDVVAARLMIDNVAKLVRRHLVLFVTLTDPAPREIAGAAPRSIGDVHRAVVAGQFLRERETVLQELRRLGAHCIDSEPGELQGQIVHRYLWIKRRELI